VGCEECYLMQRGNHFYAYRWKEASILIIGCQRHVNEVVIALNKAQRMDDDGKTD
jgi:hypothetical protein